MRKLRSSATLPIRSGGITRRSALIGGSVVEYTPSSATSRTPCGDHDRANTWTQSTTNRIHSSAMKVHRTTSSTIPTASTCQRVLALVEESTLDDALLVLGGDRDVRRREQEHLVGDALDRATRGKDEPSREVDETLGVGVVHLGEVHDHRRALAEVLADGARLVVGARVQGRDAGQLSHH